MISKYNRIYYCAVLSRFILFGTKNSHGKETEMNKFISKIISLGLCAGMLCTTCAFAADPITATKKDSLVTVKVEELNPGEETTLFVVGNGVTIEQAFADTTKVFYIDQTVADKTGVASFSFSQTGSAPLDIYSGYSSMSDTDTPYKTVLDESVTPEPPVEDDGDYILGDVTGDKIVNGSDALAIVLYFVKGTQFEYEYGLLAGEVTGDNVINGSDALAVVLNFVKGTPFPKK